LAETGLNLPLAPMNRLSLSSAAQLRLLTLAGIVLIWEALSASGLLFRGVVPSVLTIAAAVAELVIAPNFWTNLSVTLFEITVALAIGTVSGIAVGLAVGGNRFVGLAFEPYVRAFASIPKIILFPILLVIFGVGINSKIAIGAIAAFFPVALSTAAGMREVNPVLVRVGRSFGVSIVQMVWKIYLPSMVAPILSGLRVSLGVAIVVCLMGEIRYSNMGLGFMVMQGYRLARFADMYAIIIVIFALAAIGNSAIERLSRNYKT
jgi:ABC-type nitrate/sulfonate/bicarbonate transport system permease component